MRSTYFTCIVPGCGNNTRNNPQESFFYLPKTVDIFEQWARNMNFEDVLRKPTSRRKHCKICGTHFVYSCFQTAEKKKLNRRVVPTILTLERDVILPEGIEPLQEARPEPSQEAVPETSQASIPEPLHEAIPGPSGNPVTAGLSQASFADGMVIVSLQSPDVSNSQIISKTQPYAKGYSYLGPEQSSNV
ncbi:uncharacterized protein CBL_09013 [Carabus blaptoides fortunei]